MRSVFLLDPISDAVKQYPLSPFRNVRTSSGHFARSSGINSGAQPAQKSERPPTQKANAFLFASVTKGGSPIQGRAHTTSSGILLRGRLLICVGRKNAPASNTRILSFLLIS